jgi:polyisoprenoid-binding protein YceI
MMTRSLFFIVFGIAAISLKAQEQKWNLNSTHSELSYSANHLLHPWKGITTDLKGILVLQAQTDEIKELAVLTLVRDFDSQNEGRDAHALEVLEALSYPDVRFYSNLIERNKDSLLIHGQLDFHGVLKNTTIVAYQEKNAEKLVISGAFKIIPTQFGIQLPSFMMVKIDDVLEFEFKLEFTP